ncbi:acetylxylan esterase [Mangrovibacterium lignilyticum]|uniref:acetylxylan esterase n=1 Tax=Mangrovibacterium lignilyticum TaxID=2668052 RepID=UPI0013D32454|nr:acetylxylan esterase [Mangrovibacterium lignilyticum]
MIKKILLLVFVTLQVSVFAQNSPAPIKLIDVVLSPAHADWNYKTGEKAEVAVRILRFGVPIPDVEISYSYGPELMEPEKKETRLLKDGTGKINMGTTKVPGFRELKVSVKVDGHTYANQVKLAFSPDAIQPTVENPEDFDAFWGEAVANARQIDFEAQLELMPEYSTETVNVYLLSLNAGIGKKRIFGYLCKPKGEGKYPVLFSPPGAGVKPIKPYTGFADLGFISLSIEIHGISPLMDSESYKQVSNAFGDYMFSKMDSRDGYYYKAVYLGCVRAVDYLCSLPEFDGQHAVVTGGSQGGALTIVTAALNEKVSALSAFYPALCDMTGYLHGRAGGWPHVFRSDKQEYMATPAKIKTAAYYDVVNFARRIRVPGFYSTGYNDHTCCPTSVFSAFNVISAPKEIVITPNSGHWRFGETNEKSLQFLKEQAGME